MSDKHPKTELLIAFANNDLQDSEEKTFVKDHIENCDICFQKVTEFAAQQIDMEKHKGFLLDFRAAMFKDTDEYKEHMKELKNIDAEQMQKAYEESEQYQEHLRELQEADPFYQEGRRLVAEQEQKAAYEAEQEELGRIYQELMEKDAYEASEQYQEHLVEMREVEPLYEFTRELEEADPFYQEGRRLVAEQEQKAAYEAQQEELGKIHQELTQKAIEEAEQLNVEREKGSGVESIEKTVKDKKIPFIPYHLLNRTAANLQSRFSAFVAILITTAYLSSVFIFRVSTGLIYTLQPPRIVRSINISIEKPIVELNDGWINIAIDGSVSGVKMKLQDLAGNILFSSDIEVLESSDGKNYLMDLSTIDFKRNQYDLIIYKDNGSNIKELLYDSKITIKRK